MTNYKLFNIFTEVFILHKKGFFTGLNLCAIFFLSVYVDKLYFNQDGTIQKVMQTM